MNKKIITKYQRCKDYVLWYYFRYYPSKNRLIEKINEKTLNNKEFTDRLFKEIGNLINDREVLDSRVQNLLFRNKNKNYIINNLVQKKFLKEDILFTLKKYTQEGVSYLHEHFVHKKIETLKKKGKSKTYIKNKLIEQPEDKDLVNNLLDSLYSNSDTDEILIIEYNKLKNKNIEQQKILQKLLYKGFHYGDIQKIIKP